MHTNGSGPGVRARAVHVVPERRESEGRMSLGFRRQGPWWMSLPPTTSLDGCGEENPAWSNQIQQNPIHNFTCIITVTAKYMKLKLNRVIWTAETKRERMAQLICLRRQYSGFEMASHDSERREGRDVTVFGCGGVL
ncbi:hypothetical protein DEO72_LG11g1811 [Vigna unguiculata]|uniref:Uncharacterized protein n=1 Tax=Vigna unguiculata TaxID=3917 RepID=A0A4D6NRA0_VIGUN|nr:hypothetical protein DEO72_LG11g1811 [Vigna unguiculata]